MVKKEKIEYYYDEEPVVDGFHNALLTDDAKFKIHHVVKKRANTTFMIINYLVYSILFISGLFVAGIILASLSNLNYLNLNSLLFISIFGGLVVSFMIHVFFPENMLLYDDVVVHVIDDDDLECG